MACGCNKKRQEFEVVADGGQGTVLFTSTSEPTARTVAGRYPNSIVRERGTTPPTKTA